MNAATVYLCTCPCGRTTSRAYARKHGGKCKACVTWKAPAPSGPTRTERIIDSGYQAYAREEGHFDTGGDQ